MTAVLLLHLQDLKAGSKRPPIDATESCDDELWDNMDQVKDEEQREHKTSL